MGVDRARARRHRLFRAVIGRQLPHFELDETERAFRSGVVNRGHRRDRLAAIAHLLPRQGVLAARDRQHAEGLVAIGAGDDGLDAGEPQGGGDIDFEDLGMGVRAAEDAARQQARREEIGRIFRPPRHLVRPIDHGHVGADRVRSGALAHGATPPAWSSAAYFTASMILT